LDCFACCLVHSGSCLAYSLTWKWRRHVPRKHRLTFNRLHSIISQKIELFITHCMLRILYIFDPKFWDSISLQNVQYMWDLRFLQQWLCEDNFFLRYDDVTSQETVIFCVPYYKWCTRWRSWLRHYATSQKVVGSSPDDVNGPPSPLNLLNPSSHTVTLVLAQPLTEMSTRTFPRGGGDGVKGGQRIRLTTSSSVSWLSR
jgi:hypothetical protein